MGWGLDEPSSPPANPIPHLMGPTSRNVETKKDGIISQIPNHRKHRLKTRVKKTKRTMTREEEQENRQKKRSKEGKASMNRWQKTQSNGENEEDYLVI